MKTIKPGTTRPEQKSDGLAYTVEQLATLDKLKVDGLADGVVRAEFANHMLAPDGSIIDNLQDMIDNAAERLSSILATSPSDPAKLDEAADAARKLREITTHIADGRFLFIVDESLLPLIYFQCQTKNNPDVTNIAAEVAP